MKGFQAGVLIFFGVFVFLGVLIFSGAIKIGSKNSSSSQAAVSRITVWGTIPAKNMNTVIAYLNQQQGIPISYQEKDPRTYDEELLNAFAFGRAPDMMLLSQDLIKKYENKIILIPYTYFPERTFDDTYIRAADIFKRQTGFLGFPLLADPLVVYYNQDLMESAGFTKPPVYWKDLFDYVPKLTQRNDALQILTSGVALGEFANVKNAKEIFLAMNLQLNNPVVAFDKTKGKYSPVLKEPSDVSSKPAAQSLNFLIEFSNPVNDVYSWNRSKPNSQSAFVAGDLALYFGLGSELRNIEQKNPNLNFDVASIPQVAELNNRITYADAYAIAIPQTSPNAQAALNLAASLANGSNTLAIVGTSGFAPMRRDLVSAGAGNTFNSVIYNAALNSRSWADPDSTSTDELFGRMIDNVTSGLSSSEDAVSAANTEMLQLLIK